LEEPCTRRSVNQLPSECNRGGGQSSVRVAVSVGTRRINAEFEERERHQPGRQTMVHVQALTHPSEQSTGVERCTAEHPMFSVAQWSTRAGVHPECHKAPTALWLRTQGLRNDRWPEDKVRSTLGTPPTRPERSVKINLGCLQYGEHTVFRA